MGADLHMGTDLHMGRDVRGPRELTQRLHDELRQPRPLARGTATLRQRGHVTTVGTDLQDARQARGGDVMDVKTRTGAIYGRCRRGHRRPTSRRVVLVVAGHTLLEKATDVATFRTSRSWAHITR